MMIRLILVFEFDKMLAITY